MNPKAKCMSTKLPRKSVLLTKREIRSKILVKLKTQKEEERKRKSKLIKEKLFRTQEFIKAETVMFYIAFGGEVETEEIMKEALKLGKIIAVPVCREKRTLKPCLWDEHTRLEKGPYGIGQPASKKTIDLKDIDLVVVPGVAFDEDGNRLGRGKGYYDRFLKRLSKDTVSLGLAFDFQILPKLPTTKTDVRVNRVVFG